MRKEKKENRLGRILAPTDFSSSSESAVEYAIMMAKRFEADLILIHVIEPFPYGVTDGLMMTDYGAVFRSEAQSLLDEVSTNALKEGLSVETHLLGGVPYREIIGKAEKEGADLIVMGTHGRTGAERLLMGSVAEKVVRLARCPVLTVPSGKEMRSKKNGKKKKGA